MSGLAGVNVLVTGASGFIGSHIVRALVAENANVHGFFRASSFMGRLGDLRKSLQIHVGAVEDYASVERCFAVAKPEVVFHLAGDTTARRAAGGWDAINRSVALNLNGTLNVVRAASSSKVSVKTVIRPGGLEEYGTSPIPFSERAREEPVSAYSASQVATTHFCQALQPQLNFDLVTVRPALVYGPDQGSSFFIPQLIESCLDGRDFDMTGGTQKRDLIYVSDVVRGILLGASTSGLRGEIINLASGKEHSLNVVTDSIIRLTASPIRVTRGAPRAGTVDLEHLEGSTKHAESVLGWRSAVSLEDGLRLTVEWHRGQREHERMSAAENFMQIDSAGE